MMTTLRDIAEGLVNFLGEMQTYDLQIIDGRMLRYRH